MARLMLFVEGALNVFLGDVGVDRDGGGRAFACSSDHLRPRIGDVPRGPDARHTRSADAVDDDEAMVVDHGFEPVQKIGAARPDLGTDEERCALDYSTVTEHDTSQAISVDDE